MSEAIQVPDDATLERLEALLGHEFADRRLLLEALTHSSARTDFEASNERLEFLGDSIAGAIVSLHLFEKHPGFQEGRMTKVRSQVVSRRSMARRARDLGLQDYLIVGRMFPEPGAITDSILSNALEALIGAVFIDGGLEAARGFVLMAFEQVLRAAAAEPGQRDWKSALGQWAQQHHQENPTYHLVSAAGPDHTRTFETAAILGRRRFPPGFGRSKKESEQRAARAALQELGLLPA